MPAQVPCVLKELNESAPVIMKVRQWVDSLPPSAPRPGVQNLFRADQPVPVAPISKISNYPWTSKYWVTSIGIYSK